MTTQIHYGATCALSDATELLEAILDDLETGRLKHCDGNDGPIAQVKGWLKKVEG